MRRTLSSSALILAAVFSLALAQGRTDYFNVESPPAHPIEVFTLGNHDYLAVCSSRDNAVEIWNTEELTGSLQRLARVRVGLEPVSVRWNAASGRLYSANHLGDSISVIEVSAPSGPSSFAATLLKTERVGDEPLDIAFYALNEGGAERMTLLVTHMSPDGFGWRDADTLAPINGNALTPALVNGSLQGVEVQFALKEPRAILVRGDELFIQGLKGGNDSDYDFDVYCDDLTNPFANPVALSGLGSTGLNMTFDAAGNLYVVGGRARNRELFDEPVVAAAETGFVESMLFVVRAPACAGSPVVLARDVNEKVAPVQPLSQSFQQPIEPAPVTTAFGKQKSLSMLTDVTVFEQSGALPKVFFTAFGNDRVGVIDADLSEPQAVKWGRRLINLSPLNGNPLAGPRGLALKKANPQMENDPGARLYVLNHLDSSVEVIDPVTETVVAGAAFSLANDPRPSHLTLGQRFLYDSKLSGNGKVSCATCHVDARTDGMTWDLGTPGVPGEEIPEILKDAVGITHFPDDKGILVTQSLQGLLNFEVKPSVQFWTTNGPYHWRGDRASFVDFNGAFESLLGGTQLSDPDMKAFEEFINTVHYPPNPKQPVNRRPSASAAGGLIDYHEQPVDSITRSCAPCHALPEGSNNRITEVIGQPAETAALRGLFQKEARRDVDGTSHPALSPVSGKEGLFHTGFRGNSQTINGTASINAFNHHFFSLAFCGVQGDFCTRLQDLNQFVHEMDWGVGPLVGWPQTVEIRNAPQAKIQVVNGCPQIGSDAGSTISCMEDQARLANSAVAVQAWLGGVERGFWYNPEDDFYYEEPDSGTALARKALVDLIQGQDRLVFQAVPLGSERRIAAPSGVASEGPLNVEPTGLKLLPMKPDTFYTDVSDLTAGWADINNAGANRSIFIHTVRLYQWGLIQDAVCSPNDPNCQIAQGFGLGGALRHDAPRRFRVAGDDIGPGAWLHLAYHNDVEVPTPPDPDGPLGQGFQIGLLSFPLYPTGKADSETGRPVYETAVEFEPLVYYALMLGGPVAPNVTAAYLDTDFTAFTLTNPPLDQPAVGSFAPLDWNWYYVLVTNADGTIGEGGWQRLTIE